MPAQKIRKQVIERRPLLDQRKKETMLMVLIRNHAAFEAVQTLLKPAHLRQMGDCYSILWRVVCAFYAKHQRLPTRELMLDDVENLLSDRPDDLDAAEVIELETFLECAFDDKEHGCRLSQSKMHADEALHTVRLYLEEVLVADLAETVTSGSAPTDLPALLRRVHDDVSAAAGTTQASCVDGTVFPAGWDTEERRPLRSTGISIMDRFLGGGDDEGEVIGFMGPVGSCKCQGIGTLILMFDGTTKPVEAVVVGDLVMGPDSAPRRVLKTTRGVGSLYAITPVKGDAYVVNDAHVLSLKRTPCKVGQRHTIVNVNVLDYIAKSATFKGEYKGWRVGVEFAYSPVPLDPYFLGIWLGDGTTAKPLTIANEIEVVLRKLDVLSNKHIPDAYLRNSRTIRSHLLAGLLDSAGFLDRGCYQYNTKLESMADAVVFLCRSLGLAAYKRKRCNGPLSQGRWYYYVMISGDMSGIPFRVPRRRPSVRLKKDVLVTGIAVKPCGAGEYAGFAVDGDHLYLMGDFTVTHNSIIACQGAARAVKQANVLLRSGQTDGKIPRVIFVTTETLKKDFRMRVLACMANVPRERLERMTSLAHLSREDEPGVGAGTEYERHLYRKSTDRQNFINEYDRVRAAVSMCNAHLLFVDFTGSNESSRNAGYGGIPELAAVVKAKLREYDNQVYPYTFWIDHAAALASRIMMSGEFDKSDLRYILRNIPLQCRDYLASPYHTSVWITHQLSGVANSKSPTAEIDHTDADECKQFAMYLDFAVVTGRPTCEQLACFRCTKHRREPPKSHAIGHIDGRFARVLDVSHKYVIDAGRIASALDMPVAPDEHVIHPMLRPQVPSSVYSDDDK